MLIPRWLGARHLPANTASALSMGLAPSQPRPQLTANARGWAGEWVAKPL